MKKIYYKKVSGAQIGRRARKFIGCESCSFAALPESHSDLKTGSQCPRCKESKIRVFDSKAEHQRACELQIMKRIGLLKSLKYQTRYPLHTVAPDGKKIKLYTYVMDFEYEEILPKGEIKLVYEDVKGKTKSGQIVITEVASMKIKHFNAEYGTEVNIVGK